MNTDDWESDWIQELFYHVMWTTLDNAATITPEIAPDDFVTALKSASASRFNLQWQIGCGGMTLDDEELKIVVPYVENQKHHHDSGKIILDYEMTAD